MCGLIMGILAYGSHDTSSSCSKMDFLPPTLARSTTLPPSTPATAGLQSTASSIGAYPDMSYPRMPKSIGPVDNAACVDRTGRLMCPEAEPQAQRVQYPLQLRPKNRVRVERRGTSFFTRVVRINRWAQNMHCFCIRVLYK